MGIRRIDSLDWLRGLLAFSIMLYHLSDWELWHLDSSTLLGRLGIYGVSMFFVLSGLSMALVYNNYIRNIGTSFIFFVRRIFRIWPLLWFAIIAATMGKIFLGKEVHWDVVALNLSTLFGFLAPSAYINVGAWSIGNEMVYYSLTPLIIFLYNKKLIYGNLFSFIAVLTAAFFSFSILTPENSLAVQWAMYVNPLNNFFLYCLGIAIYYNAGKDFMLSGPAAAAGFIGLLCVFAFFPVSGDQINIVVGVARVVFSFVSVALVLVFYGNPFRIPFWLSKILTQLGTVTYGVYLLHPVIYQFLSIVLKKINAQFDPYLLIASTCFLTIVAALISFRVFEAPLVRAGKKLTTKNVENFQSKSLAVPGR